MGATAERMRAHVPKRARNSRSVPRICLLGCGAIAESLYLPAILRHPAVAQRLVLVDPDLDRARALGARFGLAKVEADIEEQLRGMDGVIVAAPPHLHFDLAVHALRAGCHVLCEKPLTASKGQAIALVNEADTANVTLSVDQTRRFYPSSETVRRVIRTGALGRVWSIEVEEGAPFDWPTASGFYFQSAHGTHGVLADIGSHVVDLLCWWTGVPPRLLSYRDDSLGGPESVARLRIAFDDATADIRLSRLSKLGNRYRIEGTEGTLDVEAGAWRRVRITGKNGRSHILDRPTSVKSPSEIGAVLVDNFLDVLSGRATPLVPASDVVDSIATIEAAYTHREKLDMPWMELAGYED